MNRRLFLAGIGSGTLAVTAGCLDTVLGDATDFEAAPATVIDPALEEAGYNHIETRPDVERREFGVAGLSRTVSVTNWIGEYYRGLELPIIGRVEAAVFAILATPRVDVLGRSFNPVGEMSDREIAELIQEQYDEISIGAETGRRTVQTLGIETTVTSFEASAQLLPVGGTAIDVIFDITRFTNGEDFLVAIGIYPAAVPAESERVTTMLEGLEH